MFKRGLLLSMFLWCAPSFLIAGQDADTTLEQQQAERQQGKTVKDDIRSGEEVLAEGEKVSRDKVGPSELTGRARHLYDRWLQSGFGPKVYVVTRTYKNSQSSVSSWMVTANTDKGFRYAFFGKKN